MVSSLITVLAVEGRVFYSSCGNCSTKVDITHDNRAWCSRCGVYVQNYHPRYRLALRGSEHGAPVRLTLFGPLADKLFGCSAHLLFRTVKELNLSDKQLEQAAHKTLLGEVIAVERGDNGVLTGAQFAVPTYSNILNKLRNPDMSTGSNYSPLPLPLQPDPVFNSTPLFSQLSLRCLESEQLSPILPQTNIPRSFARETSADSDVRNSENRQIDLDSPVLINNHVECGVTKRVRGRGKRRRCRVQGLVRFPPSQNTSADSIKQPGIDNITQPDTDSIKQPDRDSIKQPGIDNIRKPDTDSIKQPDRDSIKQPDRDRSGNMRSGVRLPGLGKPCDMEQTNTDYIADPVSHTSIDRGGEISDMFDSDVVKNLMKSDEFSSIDFTEKENIDSNVQSLHQFNLTDSQDFDSFDIDSIMQQPSLRKSTSSNSHVRDTNSLQISGEELFSRSDISAPLFSNSTHSHGVSNCSFPSEAENASNLSAELF